MIKYLGSKRTLVPVLGTIARAVGASTALDLFCGTTRVSQEFKRSGIEVTAVDSGSYANMLARCYIETDAGTVDTAELAETLADLSATEGQRGYFTEVFCERARYVQPHNGMRIDAIRDRIEREYRTSLLYPVLLTSLLLAADRVDSTTGQQMAYLKQWAPRSYRDLDLRVPELIAGAGHAVLGDALDVVKSSQAYDLAYLDPPYNQHRYYTNYHVWETLVRWDAPEHYGIACKRADCREPATHSAFNSRRQMPEALQSVIRQVKAKTVVVSYNDESWVHADQICEWLHEAGHECVQVLDFDSPRYVGARIGIFNTSGQRVGKVGRLRNVEHVIVAGTSAHVEQAVAAVRDENASRAS